MTVGSPAGRYVRRIVEEASAAGYDFFPSPSHLRIFAIRLAMRQLYARSIVSRTDRRRVHYLDPAADSVARIARPSFRTLRAESTAYLVTRTNRYAWLRSRR
jgi:hypothetical protein